MILDALMNALLDIENYLLRRDFPPSLSKDERANFRRKCRKNYCLDDGILMYKVATRKPLGENEAKKDSPWSVCVRTLKQKYSVLESCHAGMEGELWPVLHVNHAP